MEGVPLPGLGGRVAIDLAAALVPLDGIQGFSLQAVVALQLR